VTLLAANEHFARAPEWTWYILFYFFLAGLSGGTYVLASLLRLGGNPADEPAARTGFYVAFPALLICPILLTLDLGQPLRFWHMLVDVTPGDTALSFKYWSPMSVGAWALLIFGFFSFVSALEAWASDRAGHSVVPLTVNRIFNVIGAILGLYIASYTGVLLTVSNQPVWSDTWVLGGLFLASALSASAASIGYLARFRREVAFSLDRLHQADGYFSILELVLLAVFAVTVFVAGTGGRLVPWLPLWALAVAGICASLVGARGHMRIHATSAGATMARARIDTVIITLLVLIGVLALRAAVIFSDQ